MKLAFVAGFLFIYSFTKSQTFLVKADTIALGEKCEITWTAEEAIHGKVKKFWWRATSNPEDNKDVTPSPPDIEWLESPSSDFRYSGDTLLLEGASKGSAQFRFFDGGHFELVDSEKVVGSIVVQAPAVPEGEITDIMDIESFPSSSKIVKKLFWVGLGLLTILLMYIFYKRKKKGELDSNQETETFETNLSIEQRLEEVMQHRDNNQKLQWATDELASVVRQYCVEKFGINANEMTSSELIKELRNINAAQEEADKLDYIIGLTDQVKFAKAPIQWGLIDEMCQLLKSLNNSQSS